jgi:predicted  nucleic acid-binding Zn-ribbon protein
MTHELEGLAKRQHDIEDVELELMEEAEPLDQQLAALAAEQAELQPALASARVALASVEAAIDEQLATVEAERATAAAAVTPGLLTRYERLRAKLGGVAVAHLDGGRCTGCSLVLSRLELERLRAAPEDEIVECEQCGRLLVR